ncbi:hypothetical protein SD70_23650 [Gordoniibacillus kamchatkensis]|uniref:Uncharacterized protein n=1 Tax=Gordoniibacillus kamchatkensis TaxID=1590651 RepID=A0ABR5ACV3_9BACL|nr:hypothetical protein SD70_23650 [Paenibacillus sp. VKM B-2647]
MRKVRKSDVRGCRRQDTANTELAEKLRLKLETKTAGIRATSPDSWRMFGLSPVFALRQKRGFFAPDSVFPHLSQAVCPFRARVYFAALWVFTVFGTKPYP